MRGEGMSIEEENNRLESSSSGLLRLCDISSTLLDTEKEVDSHEEEKTSLFLIIIKVNPSDQD